MRPLEIHLDNCNELLSDERRRLLSKDARHCADSGLPERLLNLSGNYFSRVLMEHERLYWMDVYERRLARIKRTT